MTLKNDETSKEELTCRFKIKIRNIFDIWQILTVDLEILINLHFNGLLLTKVYNAYIIHKILKTGTFIGSFYTK